MGLDYDTVYTEDGTPLFFDREARPISLREFSELSAQSDYRIVKRTETPRGTVITAWIGLDQSGVAPGEGNEPLIFGTVTQRMNGAIDASSEVFSSSEHEALAIHDAMVTRSAT